MKYLSLWPNETAMRSANTFDIFKQFDSFFDNMNHAYPSLDIDDTEKTYEVRLDVPGMKKEDIKIELRDQNISVSGERKRGERIFGQFTRTFTLPRNAEADKIEAKYEDGVLTLVIPKSEDAQPRLIDIK